MNFFEKLFGAPVPTLDVSDVQEKLKYGKHPIILDVRQPEEFRQGHVSGARLIPLGELDRRMKELPTEREIVCVCANGHRSVTAARKLIAAGYKASSMKNGMTDWKRAKYTIKKGSAS